MTVRDRIRLTRATVNRIERGDLPELVWLQKSVNVCGIATGRRRYREWERALARVGRANVTPSASAEADKVLARGRLPLLAARLGLDWDTEGSRADLLHPRYGVVPFVGRAELLGHLTRWRDDHAPLRLAVLAGPGGVGKTRTAIEMCIAAEAAGWTAGLLGLVDEGHTDRIEPLRRWPRPLLVVVDYAETRPTVVAELLVTLNRSRPERLARVVLLTRQATTKAALRDLFGTGDAGPDLSGVIQHAEVVRLATQAVDRSTLFEEASVAFAPRLGRPRNTVEPILTAEHFDRPLYVLAAALLLTEEPGFRVADLAAEALLWAVLDRHEAEYWDRWNRRLGVGLTREDQRRAVAWTALLGAETEHDAVTLVRMPPGFADAAGERLRAVARWLAHLYGSGRLDGYPAVTPLEPDLLAEALIAAELGRDATG